VILRHFVYEHLGWFVGWRFFVVSGDICRTRISGDYRLLSHFFRTIGSLSEMLSWSASDAVYSCTFLSHVVCLVVCRLSHSSTQLKPYDGFRYLSDHTVDTFVRFGGPTHSQNVQYTVRGVWPCVTVCDRGGGRSNLVKKAWHNFEWPLGWIWHSDSAFAELLLSVFVCWLKCAGVVGFAVSRADKALSEGGRVV